VNRAAQIVGLTLALAGCATLPGPRVAPRPEAPPAWVAPADGRTSIVKGATAMLGQPYQWGGAAPGGFDCSGLVFYASRGAGIRVPRTAHEQLHAGVAIRRRDLKAGDLVFMHLAHKELHVGIAIDNDRFVHAPSTGGHVRIDSLSAAPYAGAFVAARRIVDGAAPRFGTARTAGTVHSAAGEAQPD